MNRPASLSGTPCYLAVEWNVAVSTRNQILCAIILLYRNVLEIEFDQISILVFAKKPNRLPEIFSKDEVHCAPRSR